MITHTIGGETVNLFTPGEVMAILHVQSGETVRRRAKACKIQGVRVHNRTAYTEDQVLTMVNYVKAVYKPEPLTPDTPDDLLVTAFDAAHMCGIETMAFVRRASLLGIKSNSRKQFTVAQVREYISRYDDYIAKQRTLPHTAMVFSAGPGQAQAVGVSDVVYERTTWHGAVYLKRADIPMPPSEGIGYEVDRRQMRPCGL